MSLRFEDLVAELGRYDWRGPAWQAAGPVHHAAAWDRLTEIRVDAAAVFNDALRLYTEPEPTEVLMPMSSGYARFHAIRVRMQRVCSDSERVANTERENPAGKGNYARGSEGLAEAIVLLEHTVKQGLAGHLEWEAGLRAAGEAALGGPASPRPLPVPVAAACEGEPSQSTHTDNEWVTRLGSACAAIARCISSAGSSDARSSARVGLEHPVALDNTRTTCQGPENSDRSPGT